MNYRNKDGVSIDDQIHDMMMALNINIASLSSFKIYATTWDKIVNFLGILEVLLETDVDPFYQKQHTQPVWKTEWMSFHPRIFRQEVLSRYRSLIKVIQRSGKKTADTIDEVLGEE